MKVLLVEDDAETARAIEMGFRQHGHQIDVAGDGRQGLCLCIGGTYDLAIVDWRLPGIDGLSLVKAVRAAGLKLPILFLTTVSSVESRVEGLNSGGDDYLIKPFALAELLARANALMRRPALGSEVTVLRVADLEMNLLNREVKRGNQVIDLLPKEYALLEFLMRNAGEVVTRSMLLEKVWDFHFDPKTSVVETHMSRLRAKIDKPFAVALIHTVHGAGYSIHAPA
jgi:two-component system OmpR family response regulator